MQHLPSPTRTLVCFGAVMLLLGATAPTQAAATTGHLAPSLLDRTVQRNGGAKQIGMVVASVPVADSAQGERKALAQALRLRRELVQQGVDPDSIFIEARAADEAIPATAARR